VRKALVITGLEVLGLLFEQQAAAESSPNLVVV
jgi:hypothetical protein